MHIGILSADRPGERRVALVPDVVKKLVADGHRVTISTGAGSEAGFTDASYRDAGAEIGAPQDVDFVAVVELPLTGSIPGRSVLGMLRPFDDPAAMSALAATGVTAWAFEAMPRTTRAQSMDALSSQATVAGYQAVLEGATASDRFFPMLTTAAGTIRPANVLVLGAGVAGLQAIATARRLGAVVSAFDVRAAAAEQVESLGAKFVTLEVPAQDGAESGGYAREVAEDEQRRILEGLAPFVTIADVVISTAAIPGRPAPLLIEAATVETMRPGAVIVDLAAASGGNCELTVAGETVKHGGVTIIGATDLMARVPADASRMYSRNVSSFLELITGDDAAFVPDVDDDIVEESMICRDGAVVHPRLLET
ncbi:MAG TPA: NAD(P) transhydrogenase subunit alpha [Acidimicrobiia bacterium]|nr:NAD(P) transhydrogenase subunit alpha [Acidimicrobiia bacterium]